MASNSASPSPSTRAVWSWRVWALWVAAAGLFLAAAAVASMIRPTTASLPAYGAVPPFALIDEGGHPFTAQALAGKAWIADFIFTRCAGQCPMMSAAMATLAREFASDDRLHFVSFTVDPAWDTPPVLARYAERYRGQPGRWHFVTGDEPALAALCRDGFKLAMAGDDAGSAAEPITHSSRLALVDATGTIRGYYDATDAKAIARLREDARRVLRAAR